MSGGGVADGFTGLLRRRVRRRVISVMAAQVIRVSECWTRRSQSRAWRRACIIQAHVRSTTQQRGSTMNPEPSLGRLTVLIVRLRYFFAQVELSGIGGVGPDDLDTTPE